jgi:ribosomal protein S30
LEVGGTPPCLVGKRGTRLPVRQLIKRSVHGPTLPEEFHAGHVRKNTPKHACCEHHRLGERKRTLAHFHEEKRKLLRYVTRRNPTIRDYDTIATPTSRNTAHRSALQRYRSASLPHAQRYRAAHRYRTRIATAQPAYDIASSARMPERSKQR